MIRPIVTLKDNPGVLRYSCGSVETPSIEADRLVKDLFDTLESTSNGVGLSAPQIGVLGRIFVMSYAGTIEAFINPRIIRVSENETSALEGCLSIPGVETKVVRPKQVWLDYTDANGIRRTNQKFKKMEARVIQHEMDHLNGILIVDYDPVTGTLISGLANGTAMTITVNGNF